MNNDKIKRDFVEVHDDFIDNDIIHIDAFTTADPDEDPDEVSMVVAKINMKTGDVQYLCDDVIHNEMIQSVINDNLIRLGFL